MPLNISDLAYPFDPTGTLLSNRVVNEQQVITGANFRDYHFIVPTYGPYFTDSMVITYRDLDNTVRTLVEGIDYYCTHWFIAASRACAKPIYGSISFLDTQLAGVIQLNYQTLGGIWTIDDAAISQILADRLNNPRITAWDVVVDMPVTFPPIDHEWDLQDLVGGTHMVAALAGIEDALRQTGQTGITEHIANLANPHQVSKLQVGLGNVPNYPIATGPIAQEALSNIHFMTPATTLVLVQEKAIGPATLHATSTANPHGTTAAQVGAYSILEANALLNDKLNLTQAAYDTNRFDGKTPVEYRDWVLLGTAANSIRFNGLTYGDVLINARNGKVADSFKLEGRTYDQLITELSGGVSTNALRFEGRTFAEAMVEILAGTASDSILFDGRSYAVAKADILTGTANNALLLEGQSVADIMSNTLLGTAAAATRFGGFTYAEAKVDILSGVAADSYLFAGLDLAGLVAYFDTIYEDADDEARQLKFPALVADGGAPNYAWVKFATKVAVPLLGPMPQDISWLVAGGDSDATTGPGVFNVTASFRAPAAPEVLAISMTSIRVSGSETLVEFGYVHDTVNNEVEFWVKTWSTRNALTVTDITKQDLLIEMELAAEEVEPVGFVAATADYLVTGAEMATLRQEVEAAFVAMTDAFNALKDSIENPAP